MKVKTLQKTQYNLIEFHHYIDNVGDSKIINVLELVIKSDNLEFISELTDTFLIITDDQSYIFSNYEVSEYYPIDENYIKVICIK